MSWEGMVVWKYSLALEAVNECAVEDQPRAGLTEALCGVHGMLEEPVEMEAKYRGPLHPGSRLLLLDQRIGRREVFLICPEPHLKEPISYECVSRTPSSGN